MPLGVRFQLDQTTPKDNLPMKGMDIKLQPQPYRTPQHIAMAEDFLLTAHNMQAQQVLEQPLHLPVNCHRTGGNCGISLQVL